MKIAVDETLEQRGKTHGPYHLNATISQELKCVIHYHLTARHTPDMREALDMIAHKIARILAGDPDVVDHWHDISGYARLVEEDLIK